MAFGLVCREKVLDRVVAASLDHQLADSLTATGQIDQISEDWLAPNLRHQPGADGWPQGSLIAVVPWPGSRAGLGCQPYKHAEEHGCLGDSHG